MRSTCGGIGIKLLEVLFGILPWKGNMIRQKAGGYFTDAMGVGARDFSGKFPGFRSEITRRGTGGSRGKTGGCEAHVFVCTLMKAFTKRVRGWNVNVRLSHEKL